eukprot:GEMP01028968.1.p1 GENE.GEMP01028968.1~~GEMP01028968.1.p1  ORF type:complete len:432 (+),score=113.83 GEMP01028968.1:222-1517(+)
MVSERDLSQVDEFTIAQDVAHLLSVQKDKDTLSREEIDDIVAQAVNEWLLEASSGDVDAMQEPTTRRVKAGNLADKPIFWDGPNRTKRRRKDGTMVRVVSRRARPIAGNSKFDDSDSELDTWKSKASQPVLKEYNGMSKVMMQPKRARRVGLPMSQDKTSTSTARVRAKTTHWIQCDQCNKWRGVAEGTFKVCQAWESFSCAKLENCDCDEPCDDAVPRDTGRVLSESSLKWVCCDECDKWRPVDEKAFQLASSFKGKFVCKYLGISCDDPEIEEDATSDDDATMSTDAIQLPSGAICTGYIDEDRFSDASAGSMSPKDERGALHPSRALESEKTRSSDSSSTTKSTRTRPPHTADRDVDKSDRVMAASCDRGKVARKRARKSKTRGARAKVAKKKDVVKKVAEKSKSPRRRPPDTKLDRLHCAYFQNLRL